MASYQLIYHYLKKIKPPNRDITKPTGQQPSGLELWEVHLYIYGQYIYIHIYI